MNNLPEISVIVPVYKVEEYLPQCIDSILAQTFTDFDPPPFREVLNFSFQVLV